MKIYIASILKSLNPIRKALDLINNPEFDLLQLDYFNIEEGVIPSLIDTIKKSDIIIADISNESPNIYYEIGIAHGLGKPVILVSQTNNFNRYSMISNRYYIYNIDDLGIEKLAFNLSQILFDKKEIESLKPKSIKSHLFDYNENDSNINFNSITTKKGYDKYIELEKWIFYLLQDIPGFEIQKSDSRSTKEYDFILWNNNEDDDLKNLGNPIPGEIKATKTIQSSLIHSLVSKASLQGFRSFILITLAELSDSNRNLIRDLKVHNGINLIVITGSDLSNVKSSKDLLKTLITAFRKTYIY
ncbi:hypothetical protein [Chryseobacterium sp. KCF3-3]|uniref:hypothetical protein n=1 Tax=Chryseobacterium sp. KCF3-3 TaxID=3231511 RepID=UPI0038B2451C